ncbi:pancreatic triacylglycerol lipase [Drosophila kikkawai]|uniref:Pancreatic triacylglycerol lipase n=1 Tax=Drosophila kikkawai TaxID=30033 RepID=A0A6P4IUM2_DROKI|nr:pancreatic triacylglycerol lipase [Drosophila kikkawai]
MKSTAWLSLLALAWSVDANPILGLLNPECKVVHGECPHENITFWLYTNSTRDNPVLLNPLDLNPWDFQPARPVKILIHGYTGHRDFSPNSHIRPVLLDNEDVYVISIDYKPLVPDPCYFSAVQNLPLVSQCLAQLINNLVDRNIVPNENIHIIGFSLGGQVAGQTANYLKRKLKRITGLDPAKPMFVLAGNTSRLDPGDAEFVDVIHTNVFGRGILSPMGHVDFYPNVGSILQPGCREESPDSPGSCSHDRAPQFYAESINSTTGFWGRQCTSWLAYIVNLCPTTGKQELMGYHVSQETKGSYFLETGKSAPFALGKQEDVDNSQTLAQFKLNPELNEIPPDYEPQLLEAFLELDALKAVLNTDGSDLDKQLNWIGREDDEPLARAKL